MQNLLSIGQVHSDQYPETNDSQAPEKLDHMVKSCNLWSKITRFQKENEVFLDGSTLDIAGIVAVAKYNCKAHVRMTEKLVQSMIASVRMLEEHLSKGFNVYGVNTGFGASADVRTTDLVGLQAALLQLTQAGILTDMDTMQATPNVDPGFHSMPVSWVRATMLVRCNNSLRGHSGVRLELIEAILKLLNAGCTPVIPLRGSISASGDLMPLSYIAGVLEGNPDIRVRVSSDSQQRIVSATEALSIAGIKPFVLGPKEGLGLINGTSASAAVGSIVVHESNKLVLLAQMLTAMSCEALMGNAESYHPFIAKVQPHPGQSECAGNILRFLTGSSLVEMLNGQDKFKSGLFQDRYALRGASQWLGPQLEDLSHILSQITLELNSTSDNPLIDVENENVYSGGNFIAAAVSSGMERSRLSMQMIGKLLFSLSSELINPTLNRGLPPNLAADDPSLSFTMKGVDISMAAYMSELAYLTNPVTSHVQSAESHNQSINSLALISARYSIRAADIVAQMCAAHLYVVCQALDLRCLHLSYLKDLKKGLSSISSSLFPEASALLQKGFQDDLSKHLADSWNANGQFDLSEKCARLAKDALPVLINHFQQHQLVLTMDIIRNFESSLRETAEAVFLARKKEFLQRPNTLSFLGGASKRLYYFVREELGIPFHQGLIEHPGINPEEKINGRGKKTIGSWISILFSAVSSDKIWEPMAEIVKADAARPNL